MVPAPRPGSKNLHELAQYLVENGPVNHASASPRRVRILHKGQYIADTTHAVWVWEHGAYPYFYLPRGSFAKDVSFDGDKDSEERGGKGSAMLAEMRGGDWTCDRVVMFKGEEGWNGDMVRVEFGAVDQWLEEDLPIFIHPKDPHKRIFTLPSSRHIRITIPHPHPSDPSTTLELADTAYSIHLHEGSLPVRYYMPLPAIQVQYLRKSATKSLCPYKGEAEYYDVVIPGGGKDGETVLKDLVWYYERPNLEVAAVQGLCCFYGEKVHVWVDGVKLDRP